MMTRKGKHLSGETRAFIREQVLSGKSKSQVARDFNISFRTVWEYTKDVRRVISEETKERIRQEVRSGKSKYRVAKELGLDYNLVMKYTKDFPNASRSNPCIYGKSFDLLKQLLTTGVVYSTTETRQVMRTMKRHLPMIRYSRFKNKAVYYLDDKNKKALQSLLEIDSSKIINYRELDDLLHIFHIKVDVEEKKTFLGRNGPKRMRKIKETAFRYGSFSKEKQTKIDDFLGRFLHSEVL
jgi:transposase-like protein